MQPAYQFGLAPFIVEIDEAAHLLPLLQVFGSIYFSCVEKLTLSTVLQKIHGWSVTSGSPRRLEKTHLNTTQLQRKDQPERREDSQIRKLRRSPECNK
jgi:hypothetical protein